MFVVNSEYKKNFLLAGKMAKEVRAFGQSLIVPGASYREVIGRIIAKIAEVGGKPAFPPQIALDRVAAHFLPQPQEEIVFSDQVVKLDVGVHYRGAIGDCAVTVDLSGKRAVLVQAVEAALLAAEKAVAVGRLFSEIGRAIEQTIAGFGLKPIKNLGGHGLGPYQIHKPPNVPNYDDGSKAAVKPGMTFAIEPFATDGKGMIYEEGNPTIFCAVPAPAAPQLSAHLSGQGRKLLEKIKAFEGLPFSLDNLLSKETPLFETRMILEELLRSGAAIGYGPLVEEGGGFVAQAENSVLVDEKGNVFITTR